MAMGVPYGLLVVLRRSGEEEERCLCSSDEACVEAFGGACVCRGLCTAGESACVRAPSLSPSACARTPSPPPSARGVNDLTCSAVDAISASASCRVEDCDLVFFFGIAREKRDGMMACV